MSFRFFQVARTESGTLLWEWIARTFSCGKRQALAMLHQEKVRIQGKPCRNPQLRLRAGQRLEIAQLQSKPVPVSRPKPGPSSPRIKLVYVDDAIIVVEKPAGLTTMRHAEEAAEFGQRGKRFLPKTLADLLPSALASSLNKKPGQVRAVHRLDRETSGLVIFARTPEAERYLGQQFRQHSIGRKYLAVVRGVPTETRIESWLVRDRGDGRRGSGPPGEGQRAVTHVRVRENLGDYSLVECVLETGRTHQVRIHLGEVGTPLCGEKIYDRPIHGKPYPDGSSIRRVALHACYLEIVHPVTQKKLSWISPLPADFEHLLKALRRRVEKKKPGDESSPG